MDLWTFLVCAIAAIAFFTLCVCAYNIIQILTTDRRARKVALLDSKEHHVRLSRVETAITYEPKRIELDR